MDYLTDGLTFSDTHGRRVWARDERTEVNFKCFFYFVQRSWKIPQDDFGATLHGKEIGKGAKRHRAQGQKRMSIKLTYMRPYAPRTTTLSCENLHINIENTEHVCLQVWLAIEQIRVCIDTTKWVGRCAPHLERSLKPGIFETNKKAVVVVAGDTLIYAVLHKATRSRWELCTKCIICQKT